MIEDLDHAGPARDVANQLTPPNIPHRGEDVSFEGLLSVTQQDNMTGAGCVEDSLGDHKVIHERLA